MSAKTDRIYTINLGKVLLAPDNRRATRAINMIREFARHHMGVFDVKIDTDVSQYIWKKGIRHPPRKIQVRMHKTDDGHVLISKYDDEIQQQIEAHESDVEKDVPEITTNETKPSTSDTVDSENTPTPADDTTNETKPSTSDTVDSENTPTPADDTTNETKPSTSDTVDSENTPTPADDTTDTKQESISKPKSEY
ncbi:MAG: Ribosomal protein L31e [Cenarchaeum symbiont of Oopsacas minuta]|nr:Ribosomal protein L31e [Cenarchaeum symbiont of Oopsacas minuta]